MTYLHRLYLFLSPVTTHPKQVILSILYIATKSENGVEGFSTNNFLSKVVKVGLPPMTREDLLQPEIGIVAGMKWSLLVRQSWRGIWGAMAVLWEGKNEPDEKRRISAERARAAEDWLKKEAPFCDAQFLYTESQLMWAALLGFDRELVEPWLKARLPDEVWEAINECCEVFVQKKRKFVAPEGSDVPLVIRYGKEVEAVDAREADKAVHFTVKAIEVKEKEKREKEKEEQERKDAMKREAKKKREEERRRQDDVFGEAL